MNTRGVLQPAAVGRIFSLRRAPAAGRPRPHHRPPLDRRAGSARPSSLGCCQRVGRVPDPPRPSSMPIDVDGGLIWSGGTGFGAIGSVYRQRGQPRERLHHHQEAKGARQYRHARHGCRVLLSQSLVAENPAAASHPSVSFSASSLAWAYSCSYRSRASTANFNLQGASNTAAAINPSTKHPTAIDPNTSRPAVRIAAAPRKDATSACAASSVPVRCLIPATIDSWSASAWRPASYASSSSVFTARSPTLHATTARRGGGRLRRRRRRRPSSARAR